MSNDNSTKENIIAPAIGRGLSAIAHRRTTPVAAKSGRAKTELPVQEKSVATTCAYSCSCAM
ncbi:MAG: hypothetical protein QNJ29_07695 [Rhizobiaceae bacterium]|nr:hypothetical protein [Rhizobiaceae bacterium]